MGAVENNFIRAIGYIVIFVYFLNVVYPLKLEQCLFFMPLDKSQRNKLIIEDIFFREFLVILIYVVYSICYILFCDKQRYEALIIGGMYLISLTMLFCIKDLWDKNVHESVKLRKLVLILNITGFFLFMFLMLPSKPSTNIKAFGGLIGIIYGQIPSGIVINMTKFANIVAFGTMILYISFHIKSIIDSYSDYSLQFGNK